MNLEEPVLDTVRHIRNVQYFLNLMIKDLLERSRTHDKSKLESPEKEVFEKYTPLLKDSTYGSDEYWQFLKEMKPALDHHYAKNMHHPESFNEGIDGMSLIDLVELMADWKSSSMRHADGDLNKSIEINIKRFNLSPQLVNILKNTAMFFSTHG